MTKISTEQARQVLKEAGYYVDNLWSINDVYTEGIDVSDDDKYDILDKVLQGEWIMEQINVSIADEVDDFRIKTLLNNL
jgi:hypothetical protein